MSIWVNDNGTAERKDGGIALPIDSILSDNSENPVQNKIIKQALDDKQDILTFDNTPTSNSDNPVKSGGIKSAIDDATSNLVTSTQLTQGLATKQNTLTFDSTPTNGSTNPVTSGGIYNAFNNFITIVEDKTADYVNQLISVVTSLSSNQRTCSKLLVFWTGDEILLHFSTSITSNIIIYESMPGTNNNNDLYYYKLIINDTNNTVKFQLLGLSASGGALTPIEYTVPYWKLFYPTNI